jgi:hypothetical protein
MLRDAIEAVFRKLNTVDEAAAACSRKVRLAPTEPALLEHRTVRAAGSLFMVSARVLRIDFLLEWQRVARRLHCSEQPRGHVLP